MRETIASRTSSSVASRWWTISSLETVAAPCQTNMRAYLRMVSALAREKRKVAAWTEAGNYRLYRESDAGKPDRDGRAGPEIPCATDDLARLGLPHVHSGACRV